MKRQCSNTWRRRATVVICAALLVVGIAVSPLVISWIRVERIVRPHLDRAEKKANDAINAHIAIIEDFFNQSKQRCRSFAKAVLKLRWSNPDEQQIAALFNEHVFSSQHITQLCEQTLESYVQHLRSIDNEMLVDLRADIKESYPGEFGIEYFSDDRLRAVYDTFVADAVKLAMHRAKVGVQQDIATMVLTFGAERMTTGMVRWLKLPKLARWRLLRLNVVWLLVGFALDAVIEERTIAELTTRVNEQLDELKSRIIDGDASKKGLRTLLEKLAKDTAKARRRSVVKILLAQEISQ